ncbi:hypothetical protein CK203_025938 [Vitis vinifera]|nr:hypothetical protein CK203_025938 [Vitis vinifera]
MPSGRSMERRSRDKQKEAAATMSNEEDDARVHKDQDDARQYRCFKKYEEIVKQVLLIDEMTDSMDHRARYQRHRRNATTSTTSMPEQGNIDGMLVQTITRFLNELNPNAIGSDPKPSNQ